MTTTTRKRQGTHKGKITAKDSINPRFWRRLAANAVLALIERERKRRKYPVPALPLHEIISCEGGSVISLPLTERIFGDTPYRDLVPLCALVSHFAPQRLFEFGTHNGATTLQMIANCPPDARVWTLDLDPTSRQEMPDLNEWDRNVKDSIIGHCFADTEFAPRITQLLVNSLDFDPSPYSHSMDFIFIDACHDYEFVVNDTTKAFEMLAPGGVIVWHDYPNGEGVRPHLDELSKTHRLTQIEDTILVTYIDQEPRQANPSEGARHGS